MVDAVANLTEYLARLTMDRRDAHTTLTAALANRVDAAPRVHELIFVPGRAHPVFDDAAPVFWRAVEQFMLVAPSGVDELPLAWIGYDVASRFSGKREAQGFLLTDRRLIVKDQVDGIFGKAAPRDYPLFVGPAGVAGSAAEIAESATDSYDWEFATSLVDDSLAQHAATVLSEFLSTVLSSLVRMATLPDAPATASDLPTRIRELGLAAHAKDPDDPAHAKHLAKIVKKWPVPPEERIRVAFTAATLMGTYGLLLTEAGLRSKDLGEDPAFTARNDIATAAIRMDPENEHRLIVAPGETHDIPTTFETREVEALTTLIHEWAEGSVS